MKSSRRLFIALLWIGGSVASNAAHAGIPVIDAANLAQAIQQVMSWAQQYQQMVSQLQQLQQQYASLTGSRGLGDIASDPRLQAVVPPDVATVYQSLNSGGFNSLTGAAQTLRLASMIYNCEDRTGDAQKTCAAILNTNAQTQAYQQNALTLTTQRVNQIQSLQSQINATQDPKAIAELQARIQAENTQVANESNRLAVMKAIADTQQQAAEQALKERTLKRLAKNAPTTADTFVYQPPP